MILAKQTMTRRNWMERNGSSMLHLVCARRNWTVVLFRVWYAHGRMAWRIKWQTYPSTQPQGFGPRILASRTKTSPNISIHSLSLQNCNILSFSPRRSRFSISIKGPNPRPIKMSTTHSKSQPLSSNRNSQFSLHWSRILEFLKKNKFSNYLFMYSIIDIPPLLMLN